MKPMLLIEDDPIMGASLVQRFELEGFNVSWCRLLKEAVARLEEDWAVVVSDVRLSDGVATCVFLEQSAAVRARPWFFLTGYGSVDDAVAAVRSGAREYLTKPFDIERLVSMAHAASGGREAVAEDAILGVSAIMRRVEALIRRVARQRVAVLLTGESGVGKEVAAQLMHSLDGRGEFVAVNCAAIPESMLEAEFFGYERGAFTGASRSHRGYLERADGGTLFLDEVGELPAHMQAKLLRALQERCFFRLGAEKTCRSDFRIVAATNRNLQEDMRAGRFREDLFYRLAVIRIDLPPLRERPEDVRWLTNRMLEQISGEQQRPIAMSEAFLGDLLARHWNGNARELRSHLEQCVALSEGGILDTCCCAPLDPAPDGEEGSGSFRPLNAMVEETERRHIRRALQRSGGSITQAAELLGISRKTLWEKMRRLGVSASS